MAELWCPIDGWPPYEVSSHGRVRRSDTNTFLRGHIRAGYRAVTLRKNGRSVPHDVHRLVALAFLHVPAGMIVNHKDCNKTNPHLDNLEVISHAENIRHARDNGRFAPSVQSRPGERHPLSKLSDSEVREIFRLRRSGVSGKDVAKRFGIGPSAVYAIANGKSWAHLNLVMDQTNG